MIWAGNPTAISLALRGFSALAVTELRMGLATPVLALLVVLSRRGLKRVQLRDLPLLLFTGTTYGLSIALQTIGLHYTTAVTSTLIYCTAPIAAALLAAMLGHEPLSRRRIVAALLAAIGVAVIVLRRPDQLGGEVLGDVMVLGSAMASAAYTVTFGPMVRRHGLLPGTTYIVGVAALVALPFTLGALLEQPWAGRSLVAWSAVAYTFFFTVAITMLLWGAAVERLGASKVMMYIYLQPVLGAVIAAVVLAEPITLSHVVGATIVLGGLHLARK